MKKIIKKKFIKFYSNDFKIDINEAEDLMIKQLRWIKNKINHQLSTEEMIMFIKNNPIKYFSIDYTNITFDYLFPLINVVADEIVCSNELKKSYSGFLNEAQKGWYFEHLIFDKIKNDNIFQQIYVENSFLIKSIFKKEKVKNFDKHSNTLFYFTFSNVKRYDGIIYIAENETVILIQVSINKPKKKLDEYNDVNIADDIKKMKKNFFKQNNIAPKKYYIVFILDYNNYYGKPKKLENLKGQYFNFCFYNIEKNTIKYEFDKLKEINYNLPEEDDFYEEEKTEKIEYIIYKNKYFENIKDGNIKNIPGYYLVEKGMDLILFLEETCFEFNKLIEYLYKEKSFYSNFKLNNYLEECNNINDLISNTEKRIIIAFNNRNILLGRSIKYENDGVKKLII